MNGDVEQFIKEFDIINNALDMRTLVRWNGRNLRTKENLSEHTHLVVACAIDLYDTFKDRLLIDFEYLVKRCMIHDSLELLRGDILSITKDSIPGLREQIDLEEKQFVDAILQNNNCGIEEELVKLADLKACYLFIERELEYPSNNFALQAYTKSKRIFDSFYELFLQNHNLYKNSKCENDYRLTKGYYDDAGVDIVLDYDVTFLPHTTTTIDLNVRITPGKNEMAVLCARTSAANQGLNVAMCPIDTDYSGTVKAVVHNISNNIITYKKGESFCQYVGISLADIINVSEERIIVKNEGKRSKGSFGSTGR